MRKAAASIQVISIPIQQWYEQLTQTALNLTMLLYFTLKEKIINIGCDETEFGDGYHLLSRKGEKSHI